MFGKNWLRDNLKNMYINAEEQRQIAMTDYLYHLMMRKTTSEYALFLLFNTDIMAKMPLGDFTRLGNPEFEVPISFILGEFDWVRYLDMDDASGMQWGEIIVKENRKRHGSNSKFYWLPYSGHNIENGFMFVDILLRDLKMVPIMTSPVPRELPMQPQQKKPDEDTCPEEDKQ